MERLEKIYYSFEMERFYTIEELMENYVTFGDAWKTKTFAEYMEDYLEDSTLLDTLPNAVEWCNEMVTEIVDEASKNGSFITEPEEIMEDIMYWTKIKEECMSYMEKYVIGKTCDGVPFDSWKLRTTMTRRKES